MVVTGALISSESLKSSAEDFEWIIPPPASITGFFESRINFAAFLICNGWPFLVGLYPGNSILTSVL